MTLRIADLIIEPPVLLAPLAGYASLPMRLLSRRAGAGVAYSEMVSALGLRHGNRSTRELLTTCPGERPVAIQLFGADPEAMAEAAGAAREAGADLVDVNLGCTVPKVAKTGAGAALMRQPALAVEIVRAMVAAVDCPVTVKLRAGQYEEDHAWLDLGTALAEAGAAALILHGRTVRQRFTGRASLERIAALVRESPVPVIGNGDVDGPQAALRMFQETGCAGVMIGRAAIGNPWVFGQVAAALRGDPPPPPPTVRERVAVALCHAQMLVGLRGESHALGPLRPLLARYLAGLPGARALRSELLAARSLRQLRDLLLGFAAAGGRAEVASRAQGAGSRSS